MYKNYFKIGWRNLLRSKVYSSINIAGLSAGMTVAMLIGLFIWDELSFDSYFTNRSRLAQVMVNQTIKGMTYTSPVVAMPLGNALRTQYAGDFKALSLTSWKHDHIVSAGDKSLSAAGMWVQPDFPQMFTLAMQKGSRDALKDPSTLLLSASFAKALFGDTDPINKSVLIASRFDMNIGGVYEDLPHNTTFYGTRLLLPWDNNENWLNSQTGWSNHSGQLFVQLADHAELDRTSEKIKNVPTPYIKDWKEEVMLHAMDKLHLYNEFENGKIAGGRIGFVWLFGIIGMFVLLLACINFMNLSTARSEKRAREVGIRKTIGSLRSQLVSQFLTESLLVVCVAFVLSLAMVHLVLPFFNELADKQISIAWQNPVFWLLSLSFILFTGIMAGSYPAFYLSAFKPIKVLKGTFKAGRFAFLPRKVLVVIQFTVSITLIIGTLIVSRQIQYAKHRLSGFSRHGLITVPVSTPDLGKHYGAIRNELLQTRTVENVAQSSQSPAHFGNNTSISWKGKPPELVVFFRNVNVTVDFGSTIGWIIKEGRDFSEDFGSDSTSAIINETAAKIIGFKDTVGELIQYNGKDYTIVGVVKDMVTQSPYMPVEPAIFFTGGWMNTITMRAKADMPIREVLAKIELIFKKYNPDAPFDFSFVDEVYARKFSNEERIGNLAAFFAILAIFISLLGLFGLASFVAEQRTKEIGIRKVLGASIANLWKMLSKEFVVLVIISSIIAMPLSFYFMNNWLMQYAYRTSLSWQVFAIAGLSAVIITLLTVSYQAIKAAIANPVKSLRSE